MQKKVQIQIVVKKKGFSTDDISQKVKIILSAEQWSRKIDNTMKKSD